MAPGLNFMRGLGTIVVVIFLALAGCVSSESASEAASAPVAPPAEIDDNSGGIEGTVTDDSILPLEGAEVALLDLDLSTTTDATGRFSFSRVPPGKYRLAAAKLGYESAARVVEVRLGEITAERFVLVALSIEEAYHVTLQGRGRIGCGMAVRPVFALEACGATYGTPVDFTDQFRVDFTLTAQNTSKIRALVFETQWRSNQVLGSGLDVYWETFQDWGTGTTYTEGAPSRFARVNGNSPLKTSADDDMIKAAVKKSPPWKYCTYHGTCKIYARTFPFASTLGPSYPADAAVHVDQPYAHYVTEFYGEAPPETFTALSDA